MPSCATSSADVTVSYDMNRLQRLETSTPYVVSLNADDRIDPERIVAEMDYEHPIYDLAAVSAQQRLPELNDGPDRLRRRLPRVGLPRGRLPIRSRGRADRSASTGVRDDAEPTTATTYDTVVRHSRQAPIRNRFRYRTRAWLVDLDQVPQLPRGAALARPLRLRGTTSAKPTESLRDNVTALLATHDIDVTGGRIVMLANARALGHVFNPISIHWCYAADEHARRRHRRGAQHLRRPARLPAPPRARRPRRRAARQGDVRLAVQPGRRPLPDHGVRAARTGIGVGDPGARWPAAVRGDAARHPPAAPQHGVGCGRHRRHVGAGQHADPVAGRAVVPARPARRAPSDPSPVQEAVT